MVNSVRSWPSGVVQILTDVAVDQFLTIGEPRSHPKRSFLPLVAETPPSEPPIDVTPGVALRLLVPNIQLRAWPMEVLLVGGSNTPMLGLTDVDIFDPATGQTSPLAPLHTALYAHTATLLPMAGCWLSVGMALGRG